MRRAARWCSEAARLVGRGLAASVRELVLVVGLLLLSTGLAQIYRPAAFIVPGAILIWLAIPPAQPERKS